MNLQCTYWNNVIKYSNPLRYVPKPLCLYSVAYRIERGACSKQTHGVDVHDPSERTQLSSDGQFNEPVVLTVRDSTYQPLIVFSFN